MVSIQTIGIIGVIIAAAALFIGAGGASGVGRLIGGAVGGGARDFSSSITGAFRDSIFNRCCK